MQQFDKQSESYSVDGRPKDVDYSERLFNSSRIRSFYHLARFRWVADEVGRLGLRDLRFIEIGCHDGRLLDEIESAITEYIGVDANWMGGLDLARTKFGNRSNVRFIETQQPSSLGEFAPGHFSAAAALETLEHVPPELVGEYLAELARVTRGYIFITVPNEIGPVFLFKHLAKLALYRHAPPYTVKEIVAETLGRTERVRRLEHKGFNYRKFVREVAEYFDVIKVEGLASLGLPPLLSPTVAILARSADS